MLAGIDIGGTKCAVCLGEVRDGQVEIIAKERFPTPDGPRETMRQIEESLAHLVSTYSWNTLGAIGISCGGPLDSQGGLILSPPNLPNWDTIDVVTPLATRFGVSVGLQNDANACALAEWKWGAGQGCRNMVFLTFGTGMGAGLILNGALYSGTNDMAGEVGHVRLRPQGPEGYGKAGSFEGFCSGGGIARLAGIMVREWLAAGQTCTFCPTVEDIPDLTARAVAEAARGGDHQALAVWKCVGDHLGRGLAILVDILNPERIIIGSIYARQRELLEPIVLRQLEQEALPQALAACQVLPAGLGERVGDYASLSVASYILPQQS